MLYFHHQFSRVIVIHCFISLQFFPIKIPLIPSVFKCFTELKRLQMHFLLLDNNGAGEQRKRLPFKLKNQKQTHRENIKSVNYTLQIKSRHITHYCECISWQKWTGISTSPGRLKKKKKKVFILLHKQKEVYFKTIWICCIVILFSWQFSHCY